MGGKNYGGNADAGELDLNDSSRGTAEFIAKAVKVLSAHATAIRPDAKLILPKFSGPGLPVGLAQNGDVATSDKLIYALIRNLFLATGDCFMSQSTIADKTGLSVSRVKHGTRRLGEAGLMVKDEERFLKDTLEGRKPRRRNHYEPRLDPKWPKFKDEPLVLILPSWLLWRPELNETAKLVHAVLRSRAVDNLCCWPSQTALGKQLGLTHSVISRAIKKLVEHQLIVKAIVQDAGKNDRIVYGFLEHPWQDETQPATPTLQSGGRHPPPPMTKARAVEIKAKKSKLAKTQSGDLDAELPERPTVSRPICIIPPLETETDAPKDESENELPLSDQDLPY